MRLVLSGPPADQNANILSPAIDPSSGQCGNGWVCEHRWPEIQSMVRFRNVVGTAPRISWWDNGGNQIAFCRGIRGFVAFNNEQADMDATIYTCLPEGSYCDVITGRKKGHGCTGSKVVVDENGEGRIRIAARVGVLAIHIGVRIAHGLDWALPFALQSITVRTFRRSWNDSLDIWRIVDCRHSCLHWLRLFYMPYLSK